MDKILKENYGFATNFFENAIKKNKLFHSYLLTGNDSVAKYAFAINIAKILNCENDKSENCNCINCKWIKDNAHPAVMTFSPIDFIHVNGKSEAKKNITVNQARYIKSELSKTSIYHRVIIITDAKEGKDAQKDYLRLQTFNIKPPVIAGKEETTERIWAPQSLSFNVFTSETVNALLKTIEEPFENVTFFFIANSVDDVIPTIVSRCQIVNIPSFNPLENDFVIIEKIVKNYPAKDELTAIMFSEHLKNIAKEHEISTYEILNLIKTFYEKNINLYMENKKNHKIILTFLNKIEMAEKQLRSVVNPDAVLENLFF